MSLADAAGMLLAFIARLITGAQGHSEGARSLRGEPLPFKSGLCHLAQQFPSVRLIPAWIDNVQRVMPKGEVAQAPARWASS